MNSIATRSRGFVILFDEKEGTTAMVSILNKLKGVSIVRTQDEGGKISWEPFDEHTCGQMSLANLQRCLNYIFVDSPVDMEKLNRAYTESARGRLMTITPAPVVGLKMRFLAPDARVPLIDGLIPPKHKLRYRWRNFQRTRGPFYRMMRDTLSRLGVTVFIAVRQDVLRWALSKYHGDGSGSEGHLQFKLARKEITRAEIPRITVDRHEFAKLVRKCEAIHARKRRLFEGLQAAGVPVFPLAYEDFKADAVSFFQNALGHVGYRPDPADVRAAIAAGSHFEKVHADDISTFVANHEEVLRLFSASYVSWR